MATITTLIIIALSLRWWYLEALTRQLSQALFKKYRVKMKVWAPYIAEMEREICNLRQELQKSHSHTRLWQRAWKENCKELPKELLDCLKISDDN